MSSTNRSLHFTIRAWLLVILLHLGVSHGHAQNTNNVESFAFTQMWAHQVLDAYKSYFGVHLTVTAPSSKMARQISVAKQTPSTPAEFKKLLEDALREQAGLVITQVDAKNVTVSYDSTLPIKPVLPETKPKVIKVITNKSGTPLPPGTLPPPPPPVPQKKN